MDLAVIKKIKDATEERMKKTIAGLLGVQPGAVQIKGKTNEGLDSIGQSRAIAAQAVVLLSILPPLRGKVAGGRMRGPLPRALRTLSRKGRGKSR